MSLKSLFQCLNTFLVKKYFLMSCLNLHWGNFEPLNHSNTGYHWMPDRRAQPFPLHLIPSSGSCREPRCLLSLLFSKLGKSKVLSLSSQHRPSSHFTSFAAHPCTILLKLWGPELQTVLQVRLHQWWIQWDNHPYIVLLRRWKFLRPFSSSLALTHSSEKYWSKICRVNNSIEVIDDHKEEIGKNSMMDKK